MMVLECPELRVSLWQYIARSVAAELESIRSRVLMASQSPSVSPPSTAPSPPQGTPTAPGGAAVPPVPPPTVSPTTLIAIVAVVLVMFAAMGAIVIITLVRPGADNLALETEIATITVPTLVGLMAYLKSAQVARQVQEVHISLNSRLSEWMKQNEESKQAAVIAARAEGVVLASGGEKAP